MFFTQIAENPEGKSRKKLYEKGEFLNERLFFAKMMRNIEEEVAFQQNTEENLAISADLDYKYSHNKDFIKGFHQEMRKGFEKVKRGFQRIKLINEKFEREMYR